jgi:hypothetical protein
MNFNGENPAKQANLKKPLSVLKETRAVIEMAFPQFDFKQFEEVFDDIRSLFDGNFPGYRKCNVLYHNLKHSTDTLLAVARLIHGAVLHGEKFSRKNVKMCLIGTIMHDTGYIQKDDDTFGTGAKYTLIHIERSIEFMLDYFTANGFSLLEFEKCRAMLQCTGLKTKIKQIKFEDDEIKILGEILGTADLLGQMADREYLEKLLLLFREFKEGKAGEYEDELDLLRKTIGFYNLTKERLLKELGGMDRYLISHFKERWGINKDIYAISIEKNMKYLNYILQHHEHEYRSCLKRGGIVQQLEQGSV